jgi:SAM-dependent methyltransferase
LEAGSLVYDVGCGNGKYLGVNPHLHMLGTDRSLGLLKAAQEKNEDYQLFAADSLFLPLRPQTCDAFISIAVVHHFSIEAQRVRAIREMVRATRVGGLGLIYVWAFEQEVEGEESVSKRKFKEQDVFVPWHLHFKYESDLEHIDTEGCEIDHAKHSVIYKRYYHVFKKGELEAVLEQIKEIEVVASYYDKENWCCKVRRLH